MLLVVGSGFDKQPQRLVERWARVGVDVALVTPADLSRPGWRLRPGRPQETRAAISGRLISGDEIDAVVSLLPWVGSYDLPHIIEDDRDYVAQEMGSFLLAWLLTLSCPVVERPTPRSLAGCGRSVFEWAAVAESMGVDRARCSVGPIVAVTLVGGRAVGDVPRNLAAPAEALATTAACSLVTLWFTTEWRPRVVGADVRPEAGCDAGADALLDWLERR